MATAAMMAAVTRVLTMGSQRGRRRLGRAFVASGHAGPPALAARWVPGCCVSGYGVACRVSGCCVDGMPGCDPQPDVPCEELPGVMVGGPPRPAAPAPAPPGEYCGDGPPGKAGVVPGCIVPGPDSSASRSGVSLVERSPSGPGVACGGAPPGCAMTVWRSASTERRWLGRTDGPCGPAAATAAPAAAAADP